MNLSKSQALLNAFTCINSFEFLFLNNEINVDLVLFVFGKINKQKIKLEFIELIGSNEIYMFNCVAKKAYSRINMFPNNLLYI